MRLIDADALLDDCVFSSKAFEKTMREFINDAPTIEPERKTAKWIKNEDGTWSCSLCHSWISYDQHYYARYCLYCGAKMEKEQ